MAKKYDISALGFLGKIVTAIPFLNFRKKLEVKEESRPVLGVLRPLKEHEAIEATFMGMVAFLQKQLNSPYGLDPKEVALWPKFFMQRGRTVSGYLFFFVKAQNLRGWLFEETDSGWVVARSEHILHLDLFLRSYEPWDIVTLVENRKLGRSRVGIISQHLAPDGARALNPFLYNRKLFAAIASESLRLPL